MGRQSIPYDPYPGPGVVAVKLEWAGDHFGPGTAGNTGANYNQNGYTLTAASLGMSGFERVDLGYSISQNYFARAYYPANSSNASETRASTAANVTVTWYYAANSVQVANNTDLSGECVKMYALGI
jgi:hypothetical protein